VSTVSQPESAKQRIAHVVGRRLWLSGLSAGLLGGALPTGLRAQGKAPVAVTLSLPGPGGSVSLPLELAVKLGMDKAEGLAVRLKFVDGGGIAIQDLNSGNADFGVFGLPAAVNSNVRQPLLVALAALDDLPLYTLMVRADLRNTIRRIEDLKGRTIGIHSNSLATKTTSHLLLDLVLRSRGIAAAEVNFIAAGQNWETQSSAFISRTVDASMCDEPFGTRLAAEKLAFELYSTGNADDAAKTPGAGFLRAALIARRDRVEARTDVAERMVRVVRRSLGWIAEQGPVKVADALALRDAERQSFLDVCRKYPRQYSREGAFSSAQLRETQVFFRAIDPANVAAQRYEIDSMIVDRWSGRKP
jgi:NitT/TauT family transport system substrate-binding protein